MKIRLAVILSDEKYLSRFSDLVTLRYADKIELSVFTQAKVCEEMLRKNRPDMILAEKAFLEEPLDGFANCRLVCFAEEQGVRMWKGYPAICKYQKISAIYKCIADLYAEKMEEEAVKLRQAQDKKEKLKTQKKRLSIPGAFLYHVPDDLVPFCRRQPVQPPHQTCDLSRTLLR